ncbi:helix-turn-helix domain-containing protein [Lentzea sp.]|uniref:helix-turn-helix domain-containing protein n=1 Tax=Lentzea sp. TaxID=56099 RepID=UPI002CFCD76E|nr:helix-turn-helix domain-containing protein [Lentzea sp.]HUQ58627.1 helix-turn-helix domain-containing protein [Lentzea sp.]
MPADKELSGQQGGTAEPVGELAAYRPALGQRLTELREKCGYSREEAAGLIGVTSDTLRLYEEATWRPSMRRLVRIFTLYKADPLKILQDIAQGVRSRKERLFPPEVEALLYFCGVTPEQFVDRADPAVEPEPDPMLDEAPLGEVLKYRRDDDPMRVQGGLMLRREYEAGASIRALSSKHQLSFGTIRTLLVEANTRLRGPGSPHHGTA